MMYGPEERPEEEQSNAQEPYPGDPSQPAMDIINILVLLQHAVPLFAISPLLAEQGDGENGYKSTLCWQVYLKCFVPISFAASEV
jgi:hypothetical protein